MSGLLMCARCRVKPRASQVTGALCDDCEEAIDGMTQRELDADWAAHHPIGSVPAGQENPNG